MASLEQQLSELVARLANLRDSIPVDDAVVGVVIEPHKPGNGSTYPRLRAPRGNTLANGKRTMSLKVEDVEKWEQKIYARNQRAKVGQCLALVKQAAEVADGISWEFGEIAELVKLEKLFTNNRVKDVKSTKQVSKPATAITHVKTKRGSTTHAVAGIMPPSGPWHVSALCGTKPPKQDHYGWEIPAISELTCGKCYRKLPDKYERHFLQLG